MINLNTVSCKAFAALSVLDDTFIGTPHYMGISYFWAYGFRHYLRDASAAKRVRVHRLFLDAGLDVSAETEAHSFIVNRVIGENS